MNFDTLPDDVHLEMFKYITFLDRVKWVRVNQRWKANLLDMFDRTKSLRFFKDDAYYHEQACLNPRHAFQRNDAIDMSKFKCDVHAMVIKQTLKRTPNVLALNFKNLDQFAFEIGQNALALEHIQFQKFFTESSEDSEDEDEGKVTTSDYHDSSLLDKIRTRFVTCYLGPTPSNGMFEFTHQLEQLYVEIYLFNQIDNLTSGLTWLSINGLIKPADMKTIVTKCPKLKFLSLDHCCQESFAELKGNLNDLVSLDIGFGYNMVADHQFADSLINTLGHLTKLEALSMVVPVENPEEPGNSEAALFKVIEHFGRKLKYLMVHAMEPPIDVAKFQKLVIQNCPKLRAISLVFPPGPNIPPEYFLQGFSDLKKLRIFDLTPIALQVKEIGSKRMTASSYTSWFVNIRKEGYVLTQG